MKKYSKLMLRVHGTLMILAGSALAVLSTQGIVQGGNVMAILQDQPIGYTGLFQAYVLMATVGLSMWFATYYAFNTRPWHLVGCIAHCSPLAMLIQFWSYLLEVGLPTESVYFHVIFIVLELIFFVGYNFGGATDEQAAPA